jgi:DNA helicase-2/ATP-dependent DNA helicase PcrA
MESYRYKPLIDADIFGDVDKSKLRLKKPVSGTPPKVGTPTQDQLRKLRKIRPAAGDSATPSLAGSLEPGTVVEHIRFGKGIVAGIEGKGQDQKAEINFENGGLKKLLLRFAKLKIVE